MRSDFLRRVLTHSQGWCDDVATTPVETCEQQAALAFARAVSGLEREHGPDWRRWRWGDAHPAVLEHQPFEQSPALRDWFSTVLPIGGDSSTINVAHPGTTREGIAFGAVHGPGYRAIYDLADLDRSRWVAATGQSGHPLSPHYRDLTSAWQDGHYLPMTTRPESSQNEAGRCAPPETDSLIGSSIIAARAGSVRSAKSYARCLPVTGGVCAWRRARPSAAGCVRCG